MTALVVAKRDFSAFLSGYSAWLIMAGLLFLEGLIFYTDGLSAGPERLSHEVVAKFFYYHWGFAVVASVLLSMRTIAEEHRDGTDVLLRTSIGGDSQVVLGKWLAVMGVLALFSLFSVYLPMMVYVNGKVSPLHLMVGYGGVLATVSATTAMGILGSALMRNQLAAGLITGVGIVTLVVAWIAAEVTNPPFADILAYSALYNQHFEPFSDGRVSLGALVYYLSLTGLFLLLSTRVLDGRRWE